MPRPFPFFAPARLIRYHRGTMEQKIIRAFFVFFFFAGLLSGCRSPVSEPPGAETVLLITVDSFRADLLKPYGGQTVLPALRLFSEQGTLYEDMTAVSPMTRPTIGAILTGLPPAETGVRDDISDRLPTELSTLGSVFSQAGWDTAAFVDSPVVSWSSGFQNGFDLFDGPEELAFGPGAYAPPLRSASDSVDHLQAWLDTGSQEKDRFAWVHFSKLTEAIAGTVQGDTAKAYQSALEELSQHLLEMEKMVQERETIGPVRIYLIGTYGALLGEDRFGNARGSSYWLQAETLQVPAFSYSSSLSEKRNPREKAPLSLLDVFPSLERIAHRQPGIQGGFYLQLSEDTARPFRYAWSWAPGDEQSWPVLTAVKSEGAWQVFDSHGLDEVDGENSADPVLVAVKRNQANPRPARLEESFRKRMLALGLHPGKAAKPGPPIEGKKKILFLNNLLLLRHHFGAKKDRAAAKLSRRMLEAHPDNLSTLMNRGCLMVMAGATEKAEAIFEKLLARYPDQPAVLHWAAHVELLKGKTDTASLLLEAARSLEFEDPDLLYDTACLLALEGKTQDAIRALDQAIHAGYRNWKWMEQDSDLASIRSDPGYSRLLRERGQ